MLEIAGGIVIAVLALAALVAAVVWWPVTLASAAFFAFVAWLRHLGLI